MNRHNPTTGGGMGAILVLIFTLNCSFGATPNESDIRTAIKRSIPLLEAGTKGSIEKRERCFTCHNQAFPVIALTTARDRGFKIDEANLKRQVKFTADFLKGSRERYLKGRGQGGQVDTATWALRTMEQDSWEPDATTEAVIEYLIVYQRSLEHWKANSRRPPTEKSPFTATRGAIRALQHYGTPAQSKRIAERIEKARTWLFENPAGDTGDRVSRLRALYLLKEEMEAKNEVTALLSEQRKDGGWAQLPKMKSDAYATGTTMAALHHAGGISTTNTAYQRGVQFLLSSQREDGSWFVESRSKPFQSHYESGYPHGTNQFISISAASWATTALALTLPKSMD